MWPLSEQMDQFSVNSLSIFHETMSVVLSEQKKKAVTPASFQRSWFA